MRPAHLKTKIFLDGGDPKETKEIVDLLGFLDGQTTNPTLISKNPEAQARLARGAKFLEEEVYEFYQSIVKEISDLIPEGSVSIEVYADQNTSASKMFAQGKEMFSWINNAHVKYPIISAGLDAAEKSIAEGMRVNMTLCFAQAQAAAVYAATKRAASGAVFVSPFIGRLDDLGKNGMGLIKNIILMYQQGDGHTQLLAASVRSMDHFLYALKLKSDIITAPYDILKEWADQGMPIPDIDFVYSPEGLKEMVYQEVDLNKSWQEYDIHHELTNKGIKRFAADWNQLISNK